MIRVVIDTNNLPRNASSPSAAFRRLVSLISEGVVTILMPQVIAEEWRTQRRDHLRKQLQRAGDALKDLLDGGLLRNQAAIAALTGSAAAVGESETNVEALSQDAFARLVEALHAEVIPIADSHGARVATAYFRGSSPFASVKSRSDFPDAFVYEAVADLIVADPQDPVVVVTSDKNLGKHLGSLSGVTCFETLEQLVESERVKELTAVIALEANWREALPDIVALLQEQESELLSPEFVDSFINSVAHHRAEHLSIPSDDREATVSMVGDPKDVEIDWDEAEDYGPRVIRVPFRCTSEVLLDFYVFHADAYGQPRHIRVQWADHEAKPFFDAQADATAEVRGFMTLVLNEWPDDMDIESIEARVDEISGVELTEDNAGNALS